MQCNICHNGSEQRGYMGREDFPENRTEWNIKE